MIRKLAFALSLLGVLIAESVFALGIGEATVTSALNQPLKAEIELVNSGDFSAEEILPGLATREEFLKANVDRVYFLSDLRFKVETNADGKLVVVLTTNKPVREPFLNFLVEVIWPSGRLLREYALLIDPPLFSEDPIAPVKAASVTTQVAQTGDVFNVPEPAPVSRRSVANPSTGISGGEYGPTGSSDTLWDIAIKARPNRSVSPQQVMLAIQDLNPGAFIQGNINKLKAGQVLRLPSLEQIKQRSTHQAIEEVISQNESARGKRSKSVASSQAPKTDVNQPAVKRAGDELKLVVAEKTNDGASSANSGSSATGGSNGKETDPKLAITLEKLDKASIENKELNSRVSDLEEQLQTLQRLLTLKNDQLANIQTQMRVNELAEAKAAQETEELSEADKLMAMPDAVAENAAEASDQTVAAKDAMAEAKESTEQIAAMPKTEQAGQAESMKPAEKSPAVEKAKSIEMPVSKPAKAEQNIIEVIVGNPLYLSIAVLVVVLVVFVLWLVSRNNAKREQEFQAMHDSDEIEYEEEGEDALSSEDDYQDAEEDGMQVESLDSPLEDDDEYIDEDLFAEEEPAVSGEENEDVIAEVDVYIAYGRLDQAAAVLESAISEEPVRTDLRLKLLEVYKQSGDTEAFNRQYSELEAIQDSEALDQASAIRGDMLDEQLVSLEDKEHELELDREMEEVEASKREVEASIEAEAEALEEEPQSFDFDSVELDEEHDLGIDESLDAELTADLDDSLLEPSDVLDETVDEITDELSDSGEFDDAILDVDLDDIDLSGELEQETEIQLPSDLSDSAIVESLAQGGEGDLESDATLGAEKPVISDDILEQASDKMNADQSFDEDLGDASEFDFLEGTDEASTKLDLARAYIDMGDIEGAKDILEEVTKEGSSEQQAEAAELLSSLD